MFGYRSALDAFALYFVGLYGPAWKESSDLPVAPDGRERWFSDVNVVERRSQ